MPDDQPPLFGEADAPTPPYGEPVPDEPEETLPMPPAAGPGQLTLDPAFDYRSDRRRGRGPRRARLGLREAIKRLDLEQRMAGVAAIGLVVSMLFPWWGSPVGPKSTAAAISHFGFIEGALLLIAASVLMLLYRRAERREFHLPLSDGTLGACAGAWCVFLIFFRLFNPPDLVRGAEYDPHWGVFVALAFAALLFVAGVRARRRYHAGESEAVAADEDATSIHPLRAFDEFPVGRSDS